MAKKTLTIDVVKESDFLIEETDADVFITGTSFVMPPFDKKTWAQKNLVIKAYYLELTEDIRSPGKIINICTKSLNVKNSLTLDVSGASAKPHPVAANNGRSAGAHGLNGLKGNDGENGGVLNITFDSLLGEHLTLHATGGKGGTGQNGGNGAKGKTGPDGRDRNNTKSDEGDGHRGGTGRKGGNQGKGGDGGNGGDGGKINILTSLQDIDAHITVNTDPGLGGDAGKNGVRGSGGSGGRGGHGTSCFFESIGDRRGY